MPSATPHPLSALTTRALATRWLGRALLFAPAVGLVRGAWLAVRGKGRTRALGFGLLGASVGFALVRWQLARVFTEALPYEVEWSHEGFEVRRYPASVRAETVVRGAIWEDAIDQGFRRLARYIFGNNKEHAHIAMTAPVMATVGEEGSHDDRTVAFTMPADRELTTLPHATDARITFRNVPAQRYAALRFRGDYYGDLPSRMRALLLAHLRGAGLTPKGDVFFAGYDAPSTLPSLRRNEVIVAVEPAH